MWGLYACTDSVKYMTPHFDALGFKFKKMDGHMQIESVVKNSLAVEMGFRGGEYVHVDKATRYEECLRLIRNAMSKKRMLKFTIVGAIGETRASGSSTSGWMRRWFRTKVAPFQTPITQSDVYINVPASAQPDLEP